MHISRPQLNTITETLEDTVSYLCDEHLLSGELVWLILESLSIAKVKELKGKLAATK